MDLHVLHFRLKKPVKDLMFSSKFRALYFGFETSLSYSLIMVCSCLLLCEEKEISVLQGMIET